MAYSCPICHGDCYRYLQCEYPGCPDGRDQGRPKVGYDEHGPAYPESNCTYCDDSRATYCRHQGCWEMHRQARIRDRNRRIDPSREDRSAGCMARFILLIACMLAILLWLVWPKPAAAMEMQVIAKLCHSINDSPALMCREEIVVTDDMSLTSCVLSQAALADWKAHSIFKDPAWMLTGYKCAPGHSYILKDNI